MSDGPHEAGITDRLVSVESAEAAHHTIRRPSVELVVIIEVFLRILDVYLGDYPCRRRLTGLPCSSRPRPRTGSK